MLVDNTTCVRETTADSANGATSLTEPSAGSPPAVESSERARQREIAAYLTAASYPQGVPSGIPSTYGAEPFLNADPTLNALVQLGALRLDCDRAFLSLIDRQYQFIVAEMTRTHALGELRSAPNDEIFLGVCKLDACFGICPTTMKAFMDETGDWIQVGPNVIANRTRYIINDLRQDAAFVELPFVKGHPYMVSYLEVPLISPLGYVLGSYCVIDNKVRDHDNDETIGTMNEIAATIMAHLDLMKLKQNRHRSEQLIDGLSDFIGLEAPIPQPRTKSSTDTTQGIYRTASSAIEQSADHRGSISTDRLTGNDDSTNNTSADYSESRPNLSSMSSQGHSVSAVTSPAPGSGDTPPTSTQGHEDENPMDNQILTGNVGVGTSAPPPARPSSGSDTTEVHANGFISSANIKTTFFRAATTIRRTMNMDGLMFLDAAPSAYSDRSDQQALDGSSSHGEALGPFCSVIVNSTAAQTANTSPQSSQIRLPEAVLQRLIRRFPRGHVFTADEFGPIDESYGLGKPFVSGSKAHGDRLSLRSDIATFFRGIPKAKYAIFLPLWHFQRECWYAATLGWVADPTGALDIADLRLVSAFGNSVMAEVSRLEALAASHAKSNFVSSISHELRSPLHGILASSELLRNDISDPSLLSTLDMLDSCGTTLLDTFNNLLDHAIATNSGKGTVTSVTEIQVTDLGRLVEDVVEAVKISHQSENASQSSTHRKGVYTLEVSNAQTGLLDHPLLVTLNIERRATWRLPVNVGAWKRIVMNIFGNALKYTNSGRIEVALKVVQKTDSTGKLRDYTSFSVEDTGRGMGSDFIKYKLFTPFSQENNIAPGMGLGLSIVQQLAGGIGGTVSVKSTVGIGTLVEVLAPFDEAASDSQAAIVDGVQSHGNQYQQLKGQTACLITPDLFTVLINSSFQVTNEMRKRSANLERALRINADEAYGMKIILGTVERPVPDADLYLLDGHMCGEVASDGFRTLMSTHSSQLSPLVLFCSGAGSPSCLKHDAMKNHSFHMHHPIGPRKLASILSSALSTNLQGTDRRPALGRTMQAVLEPVGTDLRHVELPLRPREPQVHSGQDQSHQPTTIPQPSKAPAAAPDGAQSKSRHFLLVDDNPINIKLLATVVRKMNHTFATASHGLEAVQLYKKSLEQRELFDMVFMDISMPIMDGFEATREIRQLEKEAGAAGCKIIALTGLSSELSRNEAFTSGCDLFWTKPVRLDQMRKLVDQELDGRA